MRRTVFVVESAYLAKALSEILTHHQDLRGATCIATLGRLLDARYGADPFNIKRDREPIREGVVRLFASIVDADVYIATDSDIEGELIAYDVACAITRESCSLYRIDIKELTKEGVSSAILKHRSLDNEMIEACLARRGFDLALMQEGVRGGRVKSRLLASVQEARGRVSYEETLAEINTTGKNTASTLVEMALLGHHPKEVSLSLQKLYSQGRVSYPRTLSGLSANRNELMRVEFHDPIRVLSESGAPRHYDNATDADILKFLKQGPGDTLTSRLPKPSYDSRFVYALLHAYKLPFLRASTMSSHGEWLASKMKKGGESLVKPAWEAYHSTMSNHAALASEQGSKEINRILHGRGPRQEEGHRHRIKEALGYLGAKGASEGKPKALFHYPASADPASSRSPYLD